MGTIARRVGQAVVRITGDALSVLPSAPDAMTYVMEAGRTEEVVLDLTLPDDVLGQPYSVEVQGLNAGWYSLSAPQFVAGAEVYSEVVLVLHPPHGDLLADPGDYGFGLRITALDGAASVLVQAKLRLLPPGGATMRSRYINYLPSIYQELDPFLARFLLVFQSVMDPIEDLVASTDRTVDADFTPDRFLPWLANWVGIGLEPDTDSATKRLRIRSAAEVSKMKGTKLALQKNLEHATGARVLVVENCTGTRLGADAALGVNTRLGEPRHGTVEITMVPAAGVPVDPQRVENLIDDFKPAWVQHTIHVVNPGSAQGATYA